jgi:hypothetical protein
MTAASDKPGSTDNSNVGAATGAFAFMNTSQTTK